MDDFEVELKNALRSGTPIIHIRTSEYKRLEASIQKAVRGEKEELEEGDDERRIIRWSQLRGEFYLWDARRRGKWVPRSEKAPIIDKVNE